jgi:MFS family permease
VTTVFGSLDLGSVVGLLVCGPLIHAFGWPSVFYLFAVLGLLWCLLWPLLNPEQADPDVPAPPPSSAPSVAGMHTLLLSLAACCQPMSPLRNTRACPCISSIYRICTIAIFLPDGRFHAGAQRIQLGRAT